MKYQHSSGGGKGVDNHVVNCDERAMLFVVQFVMAKNGLKFMEGLCIVCIISEVFIILHNITLG